MKLVVTPVWVQVTERIAEHVPYELDMLLSYHQPGYFFSALYKRGHWDGKVHLFRWTKARMGFPSGLLSRVLRFLNEKNYPHTVDDQRPALQLALRPVQLRGVVLHEDQLTALHTVFEHRQGILNLATNAGKTEVAIALFQTTGLPGVFLVNRKGLMIQTAERFESRLGVRVGRIGDGIWDPRAITCATVQTLSSRLPEAQKLLGSAQIVVVDECHTITPKTFFPLLSACPASFRVGLSATANLQDKLMAIEAYLGPILLTVEERQLIADGRSAKPLVRFETVTTPVSPMLDWPDCYEVGVVYNEDRNRLVVDRAYEQARLGRQVLILVRRIDHGDVLAHKLATLPIQWGWVHGGVPSERIEEAKRRFRQRKLQVLLASGIFDQGQDIPEIEVFINAAGGLSKGLVIQRIGRALRRKLGENVVHVVDFMDTGHRILLKHSRSRFHTYKVKGFAPQNGA